MKSLKLNQLDNKHLKNIAGGQSSWTAGMWEWITDPQTGERIGMKCLCTCRYANSGGSSTFDNHTANNKANLNSPV